MPPLLLTTLLETALGELSPTSRAVVSTLGCRNGLAPSAGDVASWVGLRDRYQLARALHRDGLPPFGQLARWTRVLYWMLEAESNHRALLDVARREHVDPAVAYRLVRRVTGLRWSQARKIGLPGLLSRLSTHHRGSTEHAAPRSDDDHACLARQPWRASPAQRLPAAVEIAVSRHPAPQGRPPRELAGRVQVPSSPFDVTIPNGGTVCVTRLHAATIDYLGFEPPWFGVLDRLPTGPVPTRLVCDPSSGRGYVTLQFANEVAVIDLVKRRHVRRIPVPGNPLAASLSPDGRTLFVTTNLDLLCRIDTTLGRVTGSLRIPQASFSLASDQTGQTLYVSTWKAGHVLEVDTRRLQVKRAFDVGGAVQDVVVVPDSSTLYAANERGWLDAIALCAGRRVARVDLHAPALSLAVSPGAAFLYVGLTFAGRVVILDRNTLTTVGVIKTDGKPRGIAFDATTGAGFIANEAGWVDVVV